MIKSNYFPKIESVIQCNQFIYGVQFYMCPKFFVWSLYYFIHNCSSDESKMAEKSPESHKLKSITDSVKYDFSSLARIGAEIYETETLSIIPTTVLALSKTPSDYSNTRGEENIFTCSGIEFDSRKSLEVNCMGNDEEQFTNVKDNSVPEARSNFREQSFKRFTRSQKTKTGKEFESEKETKSEFKLAKYS